MVRRSSALLICASLGVLLLGACAPAATPSPTAAPAKPTEAPKPAAPAPAASPAASPAAAPSPAASPAAAAPAPAPAAPAPGIKPRGDAPGGSFPSRPIELVVPFAPGGGSGITGETINKIFTEEKLLSQPLSLSYKPGAGGSIGWAYLSQQKSDPHVIATATASLLSGSIMGQSPVSYKQLTPIALMAVDELVLVTGTNSPFQSWDDVVKAAKASPKTINAGGTSASGTDAMAFAVLQQQQGFELTFIPFNSGGEVNAALLGGHVALASGNPNEVLPQVQAGKMRVLLAMSKQRIRALPDVPTAKEKGVDVSFESGRGIVAAPDIPAAAKQAWIDAFKKATDSPTWKKYADDNLMTVQFLGGDDYGKYLEEQTQLFTRVLREMGVLKN